MKTLKQILVVIVVVVFCSCAKQKVFTEKDIQIIPKPAELKLSEGAFEFSEATKFVVADDFQKEISNVLISKFEKASGWKPQITNAVPNSNYVQFTQDDTLKDEAYQLTVNNDNITIAAKDHAGFLYGLETVRQLLPVAIESNDVALNTEWVIPSLTIKDQPRFQYRGLMLDLSRHFFNSDYIRKTIDRLSMLKMNVLHLHLVDDQGWRIEIKKYPKLTDVGAWRVDQENKPWNARSTNSPCEKGTYGGYLTQDQLKELVKYAQLKNVEIIPEIEMPAHVSSAVAAYPELSCFNKSIGVPSGGVWPITDIYCAGKDSTFKFLEDVLDEVMTIFPSKYIHIGGDEATKINWKTCPHCQKRIKTEGLKNEEELQSYFVKRIEKYINSKGKKLIGWDEILEGGLAPEATVMSWRGTVGGIEAAEQGHDVIMTPGTHCYFDHYQGPQNEEPLAIGGYTPISKVYEFDPVVDSMTPEEAKHVLGGQANLWAEYIPTTKQSEYMIFPRLAAMSEALWSPKESRDWNDFSSRLETMFKRYEYLGINYAKSMYLITSKVRMDLNKKAVYVSLKNEFPNTDIRYVLGNKNLKESAIKYKDPIELKETTIVKASLFKNDIPVGKVFTDTIKFHKAIGDKVEYVTPYNDKYKGAETFGMVNAIRGTKNFHDGQWQAWLVDDMGVIIDLEEEQTIEQVTVGSVENQGSGIYFPTGIKVYVSEDGATYKEVGNVERPFEINPTVELKDFKIDFKPIRAKFVKVIAKNLKTTPSGGDAWLFVDEILVN
ncbi:beta-hexosaminidase [Yeosuana aromativorans]|uniref:beta-N-acetylhexosaminidase n=1 Tax=Yeosuana aromativorans TaxID=288019 RepID=A0A8J3BLZ6_9FLAO|nr:glycoside hydrolase family 20 protein [Yeosuana aromativorans]GGK20748.1 beta-hexosaminidase [Yeosuana aromativorans]